MAVVLVTDGEQRSALAVVRSLGRAGHRVFVGAARGRSLAGASRHCRGEALLPDPLHSPEDFVAAVRALAARWAVDVLLPMSEASLLALLPARSTLGEVCLPFPGEDEFRQICDKARVTEVARSLGIRVPTQLRLDRPGDRLEAAEELGFPLVLKPSRSVVGTNGTRAKTSVVHAADRAALDRALEAMPEAAHPVLVQQRIEGPGVGVFLLVWQGEVLASFFHRRIREKPPSGGVSVYRESTAPDPDLLERSRSLMAAFDWSGVAMVEYKVDRSTGIPYLMEVNGRFWGSLQLAIDAGVDFPALLVAAATGGALTPVRGYREGVRSRWWWGDVDHLLARFRRSREELDLPPDAPGRFRTLLHFLSASGARSRNEILRWEDPLPALRETVDWVRRR